MHSQKNKPFLGCRSLSAGAVPMLREKRQPSAEALTAEDIGSGGELFTLGREVQRSLRPQALQGEQLLLLFEMRSADAAEFLFGVHFPVAAGLAFV